MNPISSLSCRLRWATSLPRRFLSTWFACTTLTLSSFCPLASAGIPDTEPPIQSILPTDVEQVLRDYENAWKNGNAAALASLFTTDGYVLSSGKTPIHGQSAIEAAYETAGGDLHLRAITYEISGPIAYIIGGYRVQPNGPDLGKFILILRQTSEGLWKIVADMDNPNH